MLFVFQSVNLNCLVEELKHPCSQKGFPDLTSKRYCCLLTSKGFLGFVFEKYTDSGWYTLGLWGIKLNLIPVGTAFIVLPRILKITTSWPTSDGEVDYSWQETKSASAFLLFLVLGWGRASLQHLGRASSCQTLCNHTGPC